MTQPKFNLRGPVALGAGIDERIASRLGPLKLKPDAAQAPDAPLAGGSTGGGSPVGGDPVLPESFVTSLKALGEPTALSGALVLAAAGDLTLAQSPTAPHFTFEAPAYTADDGVARVGDEFRCDATVVRTAGDQAVGGVKSFSAFPLTPAEVPLQDYQVANRYFVEVSEAACETFPAAGGTGEINLPYASGSYPADSGQATVAASTFLAFGLPIDGGTGHLSIAYLRLDWTSSYDTETETITQAQAAVGSPARRFGDKATVYARVKVNQTNRFDGLYLILSDSAWPVPHLYSSANLIGNLVDNEWYAAVLAGVDLSGWTNDLRLTLSAQGTSDPDNVGVTTLCVEYLALEQWRR